MSELARVACEAEDLPYAAPRTRAHHAFVWSEKGGIRPGGGLVQGARQMNHFVDGTILKQGLASARSAEAMAGDPIAAAAAGIEKCLAEAHESGQQDAVRLLHAVLALLSAAPRH